MSVDAGRLKDDLEALARFGGEDGKISRLAWSPEELAAREWLKERFAQAGLEAETDAAGNVWGRWREGALPAVVAGSHIDSVPNGGMYDGALGVLGALEAIRSLREGGHRPSRQIWVVAWCEEEGSSFGIGLFGSRAATGALDVDSVRDRTDKAGRKLSEVIQGSGFSWPELYNLPNRIDDVGTYLELHVEQGPVLDRADVPVGIVTEIVGIECLRLVFSGVANHAGTTPMEGRRDAAIGAARAVLAVRELAESHGARATVGSISLTPDASNVIPETAVVTVDARHPQSHVLSAYVETLAHDAATIGKEEGLELEISQEYRIDPVPLDEGLIVVLQQACEQERVEYLTVSSGAGHDAMVLAPRLRAGMLFVPSRGGVSHSPEEFTELEDCAAGVRVLRRAFAALTAAEGRDGA